MADYYGIDGIGEAKAYMEDPVLSARLVEISEALLTLQSSNPRAVMGSPDDMKLRSCMTLFHAAAPEVAVFPKVLEKFFGGRGDEITLRMLNAEGGK